MWATLTSIAGGLVKPVTAAVTGWQKRKEIKLTTDLAVAEAQAKAKIDLIATGQKADIAWENLSIQQSGLKDEFWTVILAIPMVLCFIPSGVGYVKSGFEALSMTPVWYQTLVGVAVGSAFGVRKFGAFMNLMKGSK